MFLGGRRPPTSPKTRFIYPYAEKSALQKCSYVAIVFFEGRVCEGNFFLKKFPSQKKQIKHKGDEALCPIPLFYLFNAGHFSKKLIMLIALHVLLFKVSLQLRRHFRSDFV